MQKLEDLLGVKLFDLAKNGVQPNENGPRLRNAHSIF